MVSWRYILIEAKDSEKTLAKLNASFDIEERVKVISENLIQISGTKLYPDRKKSNNKDKLKDIGDSIDRILFVSGNNTSDSIYAELFKVNTDKITKIDSEHSRWNIGDRYECNSYLPAYFYRKHGFKMTDRYVKNIDYETLYDPESSSSDLRCPACRNKNVKEDCWDVKCKRCSYSNSKPWFEEPDKFEEFVKHPREDWKPCYSSRWRNLVEKIRISF